MMKLDIQMFADGGKVVIPIEADTKSFEKQIIALEDKLDTIEQEYSAALKIQNFQKMK